MRTFRNEFLHLIIQYILGYSFKTMTWIIIYSLPLTIPLCTLLSWKIYDLSFPIKHEYQWNNLLWHYASLRIKNTRNAENKNIYMFCNKCYNILFQQICSMKNENMETDTYIWPSRNKKSGEVFMFWHLFFIFISLHCHLFVFFHYNWQSFEIGSGYSQTFAMKTVHNTTWNTNIKNKNELVKIIFRWLLWGKWYVSYPARK